MKLQTGLGFADFHKASVANAVQHQAPVPVPPAAKSTTTTSSTTSTAFDIKFPFYQQSQSTGTIKMNGEEYEFKAKISFTILTIRHICHYIQMF